MKSGEYFLGLVGFAFAMLVVYRATPCGAIMMAVILLAILVAMSSSFRRR